MKKKKKESYDIAHKDQQEKQEKKIITPKGGKHKDQRGCKKDTYTKKSTVCAIANERVYRPHAETSLHHYHYEHTQLRYPIKRVSDYTQQRRKRYNEYSSVLQQVWGYRFGKFVDR